MFQEGLDSLLEERVRAREDVMYKVLDRSDRESQGLFKIAHTHDMDKRGLTIYLNHSVEPGDVMLVNIFLADDGVLVKACCEVLSCVQREENIYRARVEFIIIKQVYKQCWENYIMRKIEEQVSM